MGYRRRTIGKGLVGALMDRPSMITLAAIVVVAVHAALSAWLPTLNFLATLLPTASASREVFLALTGAAALSAGFAGVVIAFGLTSGQPAFREFRLLGGERLHASWLSVVASAFLAAVLSLTAAVLASTSVGVWFFELGLLLWIHGLVRLLVLLAGLMGLVRRGDRKQAEEDRVVSLTEMFKRKAG